MSHDPLEAINEDSAGAAGRSRSESTDVAQTGARRPGDNAYAQAGGMPANYGDMSNGSSGFAAVSASGSAFSQMATPTMEEVIPTTFDEGMLRALCDMDVSAILFCLPLSQRVCRLGCSSERARFPEPVEDLGQEPFLRSRTNRFLCPLSLLACAVRHAASV